MRAVFVRNKSIDYRVIGLDKGYTEEKKGKYENLEDVANVTKRNYFTSNLSRAATTFGPHERPGAPLT